MAPYLKGRVLNAGCGDRDITILLKSWHAGTVENCDIQTSIRGAFRCDLTSIPRPDGCYDAILCNAVLEHVPEPEKVMGEFHRLLARDGHLVVSVPFLQPFHPTPFDFRRYTRAGLVNWGSARFPRVEMRRFAPGPDHRLVVGISRRDKLASCFVGRRSTGITLVSRPRQHRRTANGFQA